MIQIKYIIILLSLLNITILNAQKAMDNNNNNNNEELKRKDELIQIAKDLLKEKYPEIILNLNDFDIRVWNNNFGRTNVIFRRSIRYVSNETEDNHYDITINLDTKEIIPFDDQDMLFYSSSKKADKVINELRERGLLSKNNEPDIEYTITENAEYYLISCFDNLHHIDKNLITNKEHPYLSKTVINKKTGEALFFKGANPFYFLSQITYKHYYHENLYTILKEENTSNKSNEIIKIASSILKEKHPNLKLNPNDFDILILGNYKDIIVKYRRFIRFKKSNEKTFFDLAVNIITKDISPFNSSEASFYTPSLSDKKAINTIQKKIPLELSSNMEHTVSENEDYFWIASISEKSTKKYLIHKKNNEVYWSNESYTLHNNNREDLSLQEHYKRMNGLFNVKPENNKPLIDMASAILNEKQFIPNINLDDYSIESKSSKNEVEVTYNRLVKFTPLRHNENSKLDYNLNVNLVDKTVAQKPEQFYFPTKEDSITIDLIRNKLVDYLKNFEKTHYPIEIVEEKDFFTIRTSDVSNFRESTRKEYRMDKKKQTIEVVLSPTYFYPSPATRPFTPREIKYNNKN